MRASREIARGKVETFEGYMAVDLEEEEKWTESDSWLCRKEGYRKQEQNNTQA